MKNLSNRNKKMLKYGIVIIPYLIILFLVFKTNSESKIQAEKIKTQIEASKKESEKLKKEILLTKEENQKLKKEILEEKSKVKNLSKQSDTKIVSEKFDPKSGKLIERTEKTEIIKNKEKTEVKETKTKKEESSKAKKETQDKKQELEKNSSESSEKKETQTKTFERKKYGVNVGVLATPSEIGPSISYSVFPITNTISLDLAGGFLDKPLIGIQASAVFIDSVGVGVGAYSTVDIYQPQVVPGVSIQYRF